MLSPHELHVAAVRLRAMAERSGVEWPEHAAEACLLTARSMRPEPWRGVARWDGLPMLERRATATARVREEVGV